MAEQNVDAPLGALDWHVIDPARWHALAEAHGTPLYLFDADAVARRVRQVREALGGEAGVYYAVKANPNLALLRSMRGVVDGVDISSGGELAQALLAGYDAADMSFAGPGKTEDELHAAIAAGTGCISVESVREIEACARIAASIGRPAQILLRVNPTQVHRGFGLKMGGRALQFGIDEDQLPEAEALVRAHGHHLHCQGLHSYVGSQCFDTAGVLEATRNALRLAQAFEARTGWPCLKLNLGGGFGLAQSGERRELPLAEAAPALREMIGTFRNSRPQTKVFFELGRYILAEAGVYVTRVVDCKVSRGSSYVVCDGGLNHQLAAAGTFGAALRGNFPLLNLSRPSSTKVRCHVAGPSCNPTDLLGVQVELPQAQPGDLLGVAMSGAYGLTASPLLFLGHDTPAELVLQGGAIELGRRRRSMQEFN